MGVSNCIDFRALKIQISEPCEGAQGVRCVRAMLMMLTTGGKLMQAASFGAHLTTPALKS